MLAHGGSIEIESQPGHGSVFHARLPFVEPVVLIVEDDPDERFVFRSRLEAMNARVCEAANGEEGLAIAIRQQPHLIISDIHMPVMDGFEMTKRLKQDPKTSMIPLIVMTSSSSIENREEVLRLGADDFVTKPIVENEFIPRIRRFIC
jgi:CheY-like chemotaxis protein